MRRWTCTTSRTTFHCPAMCRRWCPCTTCRCCFTRSGIRGIASPISSVTLPTVSSAAAISCRSRNSSARRSSDYWHAAARHRGVVQGGYVAEEDLPAVYNGGRALLCPSFYEGFGLPPVEMMACGGAVVASTAAAVVETVGRKAHLIEPDDDDWWRGLRQGTVESVRSFTWERCAEQTLKVYRQITTPVAITARAA